MLLLLTSLALGASPAAASSGARTDAPDVEATPPLSAPPLGAPPLIAPPPSPGFDPADFADHLLEGGDPFNALTWYRQALWLDPARPDAGALHFRIAWTYELGDRLPAAEAAYGRAATLAPSLADQATYRQALVQAAAGQLNAAEFTLDGIPTFYPDSPWAEPSAYAVGVLRLQTHDLEGAAARFQAVADGGGALSSQAGALASAALEPLPTRSRALAAGLSAVLPGLGQVYGGHAGDGMMTFVANGVLGFWSYTLIRQGIDQDKGWMLASGGVIGGMFALTYTSNVMGAWRGAERFTDHQRRRRAEALLEQAWDPALELDPEALTPPPRPNGGPL